MLTCIGNGALSHDHAASSDESIMQPGFLAVSCPSATFQTPVGSAGKPDGKLVVSGEASNVVVTVAYTVFDPLLYL